jgi:quercetin dioxygenase-like cupin family protein
MIDTAVIQASVKPWGKIYAVFSNPNFEIRHCHIETGGYSARHTHQNKNNLIYVIKGVLLVHFYSSEDSNCEKIAHTVTLEAGSRVIIPPKVWHRVYGSEASDSAEFLEIYWLPPLDVEDTVSRDLGGLLPF